MDDVPGDVSHIKSNVGTTYYVATLFKLGNSDINSSTLRSSPTVAIETLHLQLHWYL